MVKWWTRRNGDMAKSQNAMVLFSYSRLLLSHLLINERSGSEEGCPHHFLLHTRPLKLCPYLCLLLSHSSCHHCLTLNLPLSRHLHPPLHYVPLLIHILHLHVFPHVRPLKSILMFVFLFLVLLVLIFFLSISLFLATFVLLLLFLLFFPFLYIIPTYILISITFIWTTGSK